MALFTAEQLTSWLQYEETIAAATHEVIEKVVTGWVLAATGWSEIPDPLPGQVFSWSLELGGIAYENPTDQQYDSTALVQSSWRDRRTQILAELTLWAKANGTTGHAPTLPRGRFPAAAPYPDPYRPYGMRP